MRWTLLTLVAALTGGCTCGNGRGGGPGEPCTDHDDCDEGLICLDDVCQPGGGDADVDGDGDGDSDGDADGDADADEDDGPACVSGVLCGSPAVCCEVGEECVRGDCVPTCASGVRCGEDGLGCCAEGEVCLEAECVEPGEPCGDSFDCPEGFFCEPTLDRCLPQPSGPLCEVRPEFEDFEPVVEWSWEGWSENPALKNVAVAPAVADLDGDGVPEVVFGAYAAGADAAVGLVILDGADGSETLVVPPAELSLTRWSGVALGDVTGDGAVEIVAPTRTLGLALLDGEGAVLWSTAEGSLASLTTNGRQAYPSLANVDDDPEPEIVVGGIVVDSDGRVLADQGWLGCNSTTWCVSALADLDEDGVLDVVGGNVARTATGELLWRNASIPDGFPAVADMDGDGAPDVVTVASGSVYVLRGSDGTVTFGPVAIPGGGHGGAPTVADFDGDGRPEFATAGRGRYAVYDLDCEPAGEPAFCPSGREDGILWDVVTQDISSSITGSSVFDFQGDGAAEVVYNDECFLFVFDGLTGETLLALANTSRTAAEYPLVVDVDGDGNSEFVVPANNDQIARDGCDPPGTAGLRAFGDGFDRWVRTRPIWNQHAYHVTNVGPTGLVPEVEARSWEVPGLNSFRQNVQGAGVFNAPDLVVVGVGVDLSPCPAGIEVRAQVANEGSLGVRAGVPVAFYLGGDATGTLLGVVPTTRDLLPGGSETLALLFTPEDGDAGPWSFFVVVDDDGAGLGVALECAEDNNDGAITDAACPIIG